MTNKSRKELIASALKRQSEAPKPLLPKAGVILKAPRQKEIVEVEIDRRDDVGMPPPQPQAIRRSAMMHVEDPTVEKFRGHKIKQVNPKINIPGAPSKLF